MASFTVPCPKTSAVFVGASSQSRHQLPPQTSVSFPSDSRSAPALLSRPQGGFKVSAQLNEVSAIEKSTNSHLATEEEVPKAMADAASISAFLSQAANLVKLVDSKDIVEVQLKQMECEILIRKKEAISPMNITAALVSTAQPAFLQPMVQPQMPPGPAPAPLPAAPALPPPAPAKAKSSHPPLKCPMAGTFYRSPAPGAPPFVKVGDKIKKGQVVCIIEAMKLMNEIEAEQSGTVVEIVVEDGKPVSVDMPLFIIEP
nr:biotin carboxyl carrier protein of acetyl-CoA carboxylase 2, chloroplastic-like [Ipomoea trifida]